MQRGGDDLESSIEEQQPFAPSSVVRALVQVRYFENRAAEIHGEVEPRNESIFDNLDVVIFFDKRLQTRADKVAIRRRCANGEGSLTSSMIMRGYSTDRCCVLLDSQKRRRIRSH